MYICYYMVVIHIDTTLLILAVTYLAISNTTDRVGIECVALVYNDSIMTVMIKILPIEI